MFATARTAEQYENKMCDDIGPSQQFKTLAPGFIEWNFRLQILKLILVIERGCISCETALSEISLYLTDDKSTGLGNGQVPSVSKPLPDPMMTQNYGVTRP